MTIKDTSNYIRVLLYSHYTTITGWGVHLRYQETSMKISVRRLETGSEVSHCGPPTRTMAFRALSALFLVVAAAKRSNSDVGAAKGFHLSWGLNSLKGGYIGYMGDHIGDYYRDY